MGIKSRKSLLAASMLVGALAAGNAPAAPMLQLYIEGATYNGGWYIPNQDFRLWAIANITGPGGSGGAIDNVRLSVVYDDPGTPVTITLTPTRVGGTGSYAGFTDPSAPAAPTFVQIETDGSTPLIGGSKSLPAHGEYGDGRTWQEFNLGTFNTGDSQLLDIVNSFPVPSVDLYAQINAYDVHVEGAYAHFDLYGEVQTERGRSYVFAAGGRDATDGPEDAAAVPAPATLALLAIGALGLGAVRRRAR